MYTLKFLAILLLLISCSTKKNIKQYTTVDDGITVEKADSLIKYDELYNANNKIYPIGKTFNYSYYYQNTKGEKFLIKKGEEIKHPEGYTSFGWDFIPIENQDSETITQIITKVTSGNPFKDFLPDYNQTAISYDYVMANGTSYTMEVTGAIENEKNIWIHPPRSSFFQILELNPFPYIKAPYKIGTQWNWKLDIGDHWSDKRWLEWKGGIENYYDYKIIGKKTIATKLGDLICFIVQAKASSRIGNTELVSYFHPEFGFVKLEYKNIDNTQTVLELESVK